MQKSIILSDTWKKMTFEGSVFSTIATRKSKQFLINKISSYSLCYRGVLVSYSQFNAAFYSLVKSAILYSGCRAQPEYNNAGNLSITMPLQKLLANHSANIDSSWVKLELRVLLKNTQCLVILQPNTWSNGCSEQAQNTNFYVWWLHINVFAFMAGFNYQPCVFSVNKLLPI